MAPWGALCSAFGWDRHSGSAESGGGASLWGGNWNVSWTKTEAVSLVLPMYEKAVICGITTEIFVASTLCFCLDRHLIFFYGGYHITCLSGTTWVSFFLCVKIRRERAQNTQKHPNTDTHTRRKWASFTPRVKTKQAPVWGLADCFVKCKGPNVQKFAAVWKKSRHLCLFSLPLCQLLNPTPLLNVFTF